MFEKPKIKTKEEIARIEKERTISDAELLNGGAEYKIENDKKRLDPTRGQVEDMKLEFDMAQEAGKSYLEAGEGRYKIALEMAQRLDRHWNELIEMEKKEPNLLWGDAWFQNIYSMNEPPQSGLRRWFEGQVEYINTYFKSAGNFEGYSRMMYRLIKDVKRIEKKLRDFGIDIDK